MTKSVKNIIEKRILPYLREEFNTDKVHLFSLPLPLYKGGQRSNQKDLTTSIRGNEKLAGGILTFYGYKFPKELAIAETRILDFPTKAIISPYGKVGKIYLSCTTLYSIISGRSLKTMPEDLVNLFVEIEKPGLSIFFLSESNDFELEFIKVLFEDGKYITFANTFSVYYYHSNKLNRLRDAVSFEFLINFVEFLRTNEVVYPYVMKFFQDPLNLENLLDKNKTNRLQDWRAMSFYYRDRQSLEGFLGGGIDRPVLMDKVNRMYYTRFKRFPHDGSNTIEVIKGLITLLRLTE